MFAFFSILIDSLILIDFVDKINSILPSKEVSRILTLGSVHNGWFKKFWVP